MKEIWKDIPGFKNLYQVSSLGRVKSLPKHTNNQYDKRGNFIKEWESTKEIERKLKIYHSAISNCCKNKKHYNSAGGFVWKYKYE